jgi:hypothetical protein
LTEADVTRLKGPVTRLATILGLGSFEPAQLDAITTVADLMVVVLQIRTAVTGAVGADPAAWTSGSLKLVNGIYIPEDSMKLLALARLSAAALAACTAASGGADLKLLELLGRLENAHSLVVRGSQAVLPVLVKVYNNLQLPNCELKVCPMARGYSYAATLCNSRGSRCAARTAAECTVHDCSGSGPESRGQNCAGYKTSSYSTTWYTACQVTAPVSLENVLDITSLASLLVGITDSARAVISAGNAGAIAAMAAKVVTTLYQACDACPDLPIYTAPAVAAGYDSLKNAFGSFSDGKVNPDAEAAAAAGAAGRRRLNEEDTTAVLSTASAKTFTFATSLGGMSADVTFYIFILPGELAKIKDGILQAATVRAFDWASIDIQFALKATIFADNFQVTSLPAFSGMQSSWLRALKINGKIELVMASADINDAAGSRVIQKGFSFAGVVGDSPTSTGDAPFLASIDDASDRSQASQKYLQGYLPLDISAKGISWDRTGGGGWAQVGLTNYQFAPTWAQGVSVVVKDAYIKVSGFGGADKCEDAEGKAVTPALSSQSECTTKSTNAWKPGSGITVNFFSAFDLNMGTDGRVIGKIAGEYKDMALVAKGIFTTIDLPQLGRLTVNDAVVSLSLKRGCHGAKTCASKEVCIKSWEEVEASHTGTNTADAKQAQCVKWEVLAPAATPKNCVGDYGSWTECSAVCAGGTRTRVFEITQHAEEDGEPCDHEHGEMLTEDCNSHACTSDCVGSWGTYSECSTSCGGGQQTRTFHVSNAASGGGAACQVAHNTEHSRSCNANVPCPVHCVGSWSDFPACSVACQSWANENGAWVLSASGTHQQTFRITTAASHGGDACRADGVSVADGQLGPAHVCGDSPCDPQPADCKGSWGELTACSDPCGGGSQTRTYTVTAQAIAGVKVCPVADGLVDDPRACNAHACPQDCQGHWSDYGSCSSSCGGGTKSRQYVVTRNAAGGGAQCPNTAGQGDSTPCNSQACPQAENCEGAWSDYGSCSVSTCEDGDAGSTVYGTRRAVYTISQAAASGGTDCPSHNGAVQTTECSLACPAPWNPWGPRRRRRRAAWGGGGFRRRLEERKEYYYGHHDDDPYGFSLSHYGNSTEEPTHISTSPHGSRRRLEYVTVKPTGGNYKCVEMSATTAEGNTESQTATRLEQKETCSVQETCKSTCDFKLDGELSVIGDANLVSATDASVSVALPFFGKISGSMDTAGLPGLPMPKLPDIPSMADVQASVADDSSTACQFLGKPCRQIAELASAFEDATAAIQAAAQAAAAQAAAEAAGTCEPGYYLAGSCSKYKYDPDIISSTRAATTAEAAAASAKAAVGTRVKAVAKQRAVEIAEEMKKKALCKSGVGSDCPASSQDAASNGGSSQSTSSSSSSSTSASESEGIKFGLVTMGKIDRVDNLGETLCGLADGGTACAGKLPSVAIENIEATLMVANGEINVAGYKLLRGVNLKLTGQIQVRVPDQSACLCLFDCLSARVRATPD